MTESEKTLLPKSSWAAESFSRTRWPLEDHAVTAVTALWRAVAWAMGYSSLPERRRSDSWVNGGVTTLGHEPTVVVGPGFWNSGVCVPGRSLGSGRTTPRPSSGGAARSTDP